MAKKKKNIKVDDLEKEKARQRVLNFKASHPNSFGDALEWQISNAKTVICHFGY